MEVQEIFFSGNCSRVNSALLALAESAAGRAWQRADGLHHGLGSIPRSGEVPPAGFRTETGVFSGEEGVLLLLRRFRTTDSLDSLTFETGRGAADISSAVQYVAEHIERRFPWLLDHRSFSS